MTKELRESPVALDFDFYVQDVMKTANRRGASLLRYSEESLENYMSCAELCLNVVQMEEDFNAVRCGDKKWKDVSSPKYCFDNLLVDSESMCSKTGENKDALSEAVSEMLAEEVRFAIAKDCRSLIFWRRHHNVKARQYEAIKLLIERAKKGKPNVPDKDILDVMGIEPTSRVKDSFKRSGLWSTRSKPSLIISKKRGCRCLALYPENFKRPS